MFREINANEYDILKTCKFNNKLNNYNDLSYDERLCTREMKNRDYKQEDKHIYYSGFETDITVSPHIDIQRRGHKCAAP